MEYADAVDDPADEEDDDHRKDHEHGYALYSRR
jgi:hypothetical protein